MVKSVEKAMALLDEIIYAQLSGRKSTLAELADKLSMPRNTAHNLLKTLVGTGYLSQLSRGVYAMGPKCIELNRLSKTNTDRVRRQADEILGRFVQASGEGCVLVSLVNGQRAVISQLDSNQAICVSSATIMDVDFFAMPTGRMLAALADDDELDLILERYGMPGEAWGGINDIETLKSELSIIRQQGYSRLTSDVASIVAMAVPVADSGFVLGAFAPMFRCDKARCEQLFKSLFKSADELDVIMR